MGAARNAYRAGRWTFHLPAIAALLVLYAPRGLARLVTRLAKWIYDMDSAELRHQHAGNKESQEYARVHAVRRANLHARMLVFATAVTVFVGPLLAWAFPYMLSGIAGVVVLFWTIKVIPGKSPWEIVAAVGVGVATWYFLPQALALRPRPPVWAMLALVVLALGWAGRPTNKQLAGGGRFAPRPSWSSRPLTWSSTPWSRPCRASPRRTATRSGFMLPASRGPGTGTT